MCLYILFLKTHQNYFRFYTIVKTILVNINIKIKKLIRHNLIENSFRKSNIESVVHYL